ncbi:hypothetical protein HC174_07595 [Salinimicrobium sp. CDJ15-81-2]|nr:hypothetical protein [Salinimicrobium nanhaiense]
MKKLIFLPALLLVISCNTDPKPIHYGSDACDFCEMTIVSEVFAARAVSTKGKQFKYDAIECMVNDLQQKDVEMAVIQVADYTHPGAMIDVENAVFVIDDSINSPMGANLAAVGKETDSAEEMRSMDWDSLLELFLRKNPVSGKSE